MGISIPRSLVSASVSIKTVVFRYQSWYQYAWAIVKIASNSNFSGWFLINIMSFAQQEPVSRRNDSSLEEGSEIQLTWVGGRRYRWRLGRLVQYSSFGPDGGLQREQSEIISWGQCFDQRGVFQGRHFGKCESGLPSGPNRKEKVFEVGKIKEIQILCICQAEAEGSSHMNFHFRGMDLMGEFTTYLSCCSFYF